MKKKQTTFYLAVPMRKHRLIPYWAILLCAAAWLSVSPQLSADEALDKLIAKCGMCHGKDGNSPSQGAPSIAGITEDYYLHSMHAYKHGARKSDMMKNFIAGVTDEDNKKLAKYYVQQTFKAAEQKVDATKAQAGEKLHNRYCEKCHENNGKITTFNYGVLAGQWMPYLELTMKEYLEKKRPVNPMMVKKLELAIQEGGEQAIEQLAHFYASVK